MNNNRRSLTVSLGLFLAVAVVLYGAQPLLAEKDDSHSSSSRQAGKDALDQVKHLTSRVPINKTVVEEYEKILRILENIIRQEKSAIKEDKDAIESDEEVLRSLKTLQRGFHASAASNQTVSSSLKVLTSAQSAEASKMRENLKLDRQALEKNRELLRLAMKMQREVLESLFLARKTQQIYHRRLRDCPTCNSTQTGAHNTGTTGMRGPDATGTQNKPTSTTGTQTATTGTGATGTTGSTDCNCGLKGKSAGSGK